MTKTIRFAVSTRYVGSQVEETFTFEELDIDENLKGMELEKALHDAYETWLWENIDISYGVNE